MVASIKQLGYFSNIEMKEEDTNTPKLKVVAGEEHAKRLESHPRNRSLPSQSSAKKIEPDVSEILDHEEEVVDSEDAWGTSQKKAPPVGWLVLAAGIICGLGIWAVVTVFEAQPEIVETEQQKKEIALDIIKENKEVKQTLTAMRECVDGYLTATTLEQKLQYVRHPERVKPLMEQYYRDHEMKATGFRQFDRIRSMGIHNRSFVFGKVELEEGGNYLLLLEQLQDGSFKVDWESDVCYQPMVWEKYLDERPVKPMVMRVYVKNDNFYAFQFRDESKFDCYKLTAKGSDGYLFGYVKKGSEVAMDIKRYVKQELKRDVIGTRDKASKANKLGHPFMLELRFPGEGNSKKAVWIERVVAPRWTYVKSPDASTESAE